jgi:dipeptidyl aminopeptidase/acylaminoacyl peptidase
LPAHAQLSDFGRWYFDEPSWEAIRGDTALECRHIRYSSGGQSVEGFLLRPTGSASPAPAIIYNRGGTGDFGKIDELLLAEMRLLVRQGFVVAATNYRYVGELARRDESGGADLEDVLNLVPLLAAQESVDASNLFMLGVSRGGMMTYLALKRRVAVNAAAVIAAPTDLTRLVVDRPEFVLGDETFDGWAKIWPDFTNRSRELLESRSAVFWPEQIQTPVLILHSRIDSKVPAGHALALAQGLQANRRDYELVVYDNDGHSLPLHREDRNRRIVEWFRAHMTRPAAAAAATAPRPAAAGAAAGRG